jgi:thioredoxin-like negative regulator of GroEL
MREIKFHELKQLQSENKKILLDIKAKWCLPCKQLIPKLEVIENDYKHIEFVMMDVDDNQKECIEMGIRGVPTVIIYDGETMVSRSSGVQSDSFYKDVLNNL